MTLQLYNTLTRKKEEFQTVEPGKVRMYVAPPSMPTPTLAMRWPPLFLT